MCCLGVLEETCVKEEKQNGTAASGSQNGVSRLLEEPQAALQQQP